jgi:hypothetical protein
MLLKRHLPYRCILWCGVSAYFFICGAETQVSGVIENDTRWTPEAGPYIVADDLLVSRNARLSIGAGTRIIIRGKGSLRNTGIPQIDNTDSLTVSIKIQGALSCVGSACKRIVFSSPRDSTVQCSWYGIVLDRAVGKYTEVAFTDIAGACSGITVQGGDPVIRNCIFEFNNIGVYCRDNGNACCYNNVLARNFTCGIKTEQANPEFFNNIVVFNKINGVWCDGSSSMKFRYNCLFGNGDGDFLECDPDLGVVKKTSKGKPRVPADYASNIFADPVFAGSPSDSSAVEKDIETPTDKSRIADTLLAKVLYDTLQDSLAAKKRLFSYPRYSLSKYSPCIDAGNTDKEFKDTDGSRNDMGIYGGQEYFQKGR